MFGGEESKFKYPSTQKFLESEGNSFHCASYSEIKRLNDVGYIKNNESDSHPDTQTVIEFLEMYPFCYAAGRVIGDPTGPNPELYIELIGFNPYDAIPADITVNDVDYDEFKREFFRRFYDADELFVSAEECSAEYRA
jgi:hypothetical protein